MCVPEALWRVDMCCDATVCSAPGKGVGNAGYTTCSATSPQSLVGLWAIGSDYSREASVSDRTSVGCRFRVTKKSVRQCARRCDHHSGVAQASPLCSDNAPREVHLWQ